MVWSTSTTVTVESQLMSAIEGPTARQVGVSVRSAPARLHMVVTMRHWTSMTSVTSSPVTSARGVVHMAMAPEGCTQTEVRAIRRKKGTLGFEIMCFLPGGQSFLPPAPDLVNKPYEGTWIYLDPFILLPPIFVVFRMELNEP
jgi:hypothetical protein